MGPKISIVMGIYNDSNYLRKSIESIINQSYNNWELIMCDDGSIDNTYQLGKEFADSHDNIILLKNEKNMGLNYTLNKCIKHTTGEYIARQDSDDWSHKDRLEKQINFLLTNPKYSFVSSNIIRFDETGEWGISNVKSKPMRLDFIKGTPFAHAVVVIKKSALLEVGCYTEDKKLLRVEDYHLWFKLYNKGYLGYNFKKPLYHCLDNRDSVSKRKFIYRLNEAYVKFIGFNMLRIPFYKYYHVLTPIIKGLLPKYIYIKLHRMNRKKQVMFSTIKN